MLSERRKHDRISMAQRIDHAVSLLRLRNAWPVECEIETMGAREIWVKISTPEGLQLTVTLDGDSCQPDTHVLSWHSAPSSTFKLAPSFAPSVNTYHWHKATDVCEGWEALRDTIVKRLQSVIDGTAFQKV